MSTRNKNTEILLYECPICGAPAQYSYYGAVACRACKMFFRRHANATQIALKHGCDGQCEINANNRHICSSCRLAKCFKSGMNTDKFRGSIGIRRKPDIPVNVLVKHQPTRLPMLNLLQSDQSLLTTNQWTLLSNLFNCYEESSILPFTQRLTVTHNSAQSTYVIYEALVDEFLLSVYETTGAYLCLNEDIRDLPFDDRAIILRSAADNVCCMGGAFIMHHYYLYDLDVFLKTMNAKYGKYTMDIQVNARKFIDSDVVLVKLAISLFAFSENTCCYYFNIKKNLSNPLNIFEIQNKYVEVTWKYLLYKYGYCDAVRRFLNLTLWLISMNVLAVHAQTLAAHRTDIDLVIEQTELTLVLDDADRITEIDQ